MFQNPWHPKGTVNLSRKGWHLCPGMRIWHWRRLGIWSRPRGPVARDAVYPVCQTDRRLQDSVQQWHSRVWGLEQFHDLPCRARRRDLRQKMGVGRSGGLYGVMGFCSNSLGSFVLINTCFLEGCMNVPESPGELRHLPFARKDSLVPAQRRPGPPSLRPLTCAPPPAAFSQMVISFYYGGKLVGQTTTSCPEGCRLSLGQPGPPGAKLYGPEGLELVRFPPADAIPSERQRQVTRKLFGHLERGVLLHSSRQGVLVKRLCQGRVFCSGNAVLCKDRPNKLERDEVVKVFDTSQFFRGLSLEPEERGARGACVGGWQFRSCSVLSRPATLGHLCVERGCGHSSFPEWLWGVLRTPAPPSGTVRRSWQPVRNAEARAPPPPAGRDPRFGKVPGDQGAHSETG